jgi:hypothetical protein
VVGWAYSIVSLEGRGDGNAFIWQWCRVAKLCHDDPVLVKEGALRVQESKGRFDVLNAFIHIAENNWDPTVGEAAEGVGEAAAS